jgi:excisionase family DNA binding protein
MSATSPLIRAILDALASDPTGREELRDRLKLEPPRQVPTEDGWLDTTHAAEYLGITTNALYKLTAGRLIPFEQDGPGCRCWFKRCALDEWREHGGARACPPTATHFAS